MCGRLPHLRNELCVLVVLPQQTQPALQPHFILVKCFSSEDTQEWVT
jgi:hypothetical protein